MDFSFSDIFKTLDNSKYSDFINLSKPHFSHFFFDGFCFCSIADNSDLTHLDLSTFGDFEFFRHDTICLIQVKGNLQFCSTRCISHFDSSHSELLFFSGTGPDGTGSTHEIKDLFTSLNTNFFEQLMFDVNQEGIALIVDRFTPILTKLGIKETDFPKFTQSLYLMAYEASKYIQREMSKKAFLPNISEEIPFLSPKAETVIKLKYNDKVLDSSTNGNNEIIKTIATAIQENALDQVACRFESNFRKVGCTELQTKLNIDLLNKKASAYVHHDHFGLFSEYLDDKNKLDSDLNTVSNVISEALITKAESLIKSEQAGHKV